MCSGARVDRVRLVLRAASGWRSGYLHPGLLTRANWVDQTNGLGYHQPLLAVIRVVFFGNSRPLPKHSPGYIGSLAQRRYAFGPMPTLLTIPNSLPVHDHNWLEHTETPVSGAVEHARKGWETGGRAVCLGGNPEGRIPKKLKQYIGNP